MLFFLFSISSISTFAAAGVNTSLLVVPPWSADEATLDATGCLCLTVEAELPVGARFCLDWLTLACSASANVTVLLD